MRGKTAVLLPLLLGAVLLLGSGMLAAALLARQGEAHSVAVFSGAIAADEGAFIPTVVDGKSRVPVEGACVVIPETGRSYLTGRDGRTEEIRAPILRDERYDAMVKKTWGEITVLVYKDGYLPYALFDLQLRGGQLRQGPQILLYAQSDAPSADPFSIIEGPDDEWAKAMLEAFRPIDS